MKKNWWKALSILLLFYVIFQGFLGEIPRQPILNETARNLYFHVTMWPAMITLLTISMINSIKYLRKSDIIFDEKAAEYTNTAIVFGILGCITGSIWGNYTWGDPWPNDPKLNSVAIGMLIYFAYIILRGSLDDEQKRARISAIYNIFAFAVFIPLIFILPRMTDSLHPGNGGNPGLAPADTNNQLRIVFYPAIIGWTLLAVWITTLKLRLRIISKTINEE
ncbi:MAG: cytochrome c biogenesis protein CcsA [Bacteroidota bacterium]